MSIDKLVKVRKSKNAKVGLPTVGDVLYSRPNPDGTQKKCGNCWMWCMDKRCLIVEGEVMDHQTCGYHVFGTPRPAWYDVGAEMVMQELAGLTVGDPDGTSCATCVHITPDSKCLAVRKSVDSPELADVEPLGCCTRWTSGKDG